MSSRQNSSAESKSHSENQSDNDDEDSESIEILTQIRQKLLDIGDSPFALNSFLNKGDEVDTKHKNSNINAQKIKCIFCLNDIQGGDVLCTMPCCNGICHVKCVKQINQNKEILQACPNCLTKLPTKFKETIDLITSEL